MMINTRWQKIWAFIRRRKVRWISLFNDVGAYHILPIDDLIDHVGEDCVCGPKVYLNDHNVWVHEHHSLDGREARERQR